MQSRFSENEIATQVVDAAFQIHKRCGPGLFESVYLRIMSHELQKRGLAFVSEQVIPLIYDEVRFDISFRADIVVEQKVIVEVKSIETLTSIHFKQVNTYLKLADLRLGLLVNFNVALIKDGIHRVVNCLRG